MAAPRTYTDAQRSDALVRLAANGGALRKTARETGIPETTLRQWKNGTSAPQARPDSALKMRPAAEDCERIAAAILRSIEAKINTGTLVGSATVFGIMVDKALLLRQAAPSTDEEQPIDLSRLTPEQLETLNGWLEGTPVPAAGGDKPPVHSEAGHAGESVGGGVRSVPADGGLPGLADGEPGPARDGPDGGGVS